MSNKVNSDSKSLTCIDERGKQYDVQVTGDFEKATLSRIQSQTKNPEHMHMKELSSEGFAVCADKAKVDVDCMCKDAPEFDYEKFPYGANGVGYNDFVTSQGVDDAVINNHKDFVHQRHGQIATGRTYTVDSELDSYNYMPWQGLRRWTSEVAVCNPTQVPDVDLDMFRPTGTFCIKK